MEYYKQVSTWDTDNVISWIKGLEKCLEEHIPQFIAHCICGHDLLKLSQQQLDYLKVTQVGHQELLLEAVEQLSTLESGHAKSSTISFASTLSKKTSQLVNALSSPKHKPSSGGEGDANAVLVRMEMTAGVMTASKSLISWLERNPSSFITDYKSFRQDILRNTLDLSNILEDDFDTNKMIEACRKILKLTSAMMSPENFSVVEPVNLVSVTLSPREETGLGFSIQRSRQGNLLISKVNEGSPAEECGLAQVGVEIVQINSQNVIGWEVSNVVETLKQSGHEVSLILKVPTAKKDGGDKEEKDDQTDEGVVADGSSGSCDLLDPSSNQITDDGLSIDDLDMDDSGDIHSPDGFQGDTDLSELHSVFRMKKEASLDLKRTSSVPLTSREKADAILESRSSKDSEEILEETDGSSNLSSPMPSFEQRLHARTASDGRVEGKGQAHKVDSLPPVAYRTQIIGGVVMRIPIKNDDHEKGHHKKGKHKGGGAGHVKSKPPPAGRKAKKSSVSSASDDLSFSSEPNDPASDKTKAVFCDAKEITIAGQTTKQVTVTSVSEPREDVHSGKKVSNPALLVPCFQIKNAEHEGWMSKLGGSGLTPKNWRRRWFVLKDNRLFYYKTSFDIAALGIVELAGYTFEIATDIKKKHAFKAERPGARTYSFIADSADEMTRWIQMLKSSASSVNEQGLPLAASIEASDDEL